MSTRPSSEDVEIVQAGGSAGPGTPPVRKAVHFDFHKEAQMADGRELIERMVVANNVRIATDFAKRFPLPPTRPTRNSSLVGRGDVLSVDDGGLVTRAHKNVLIVITELRDVPDPGSGAEPSQNDAAKEARKVVFANDVFDMSRGDQKIFGKAISESD